MLNYELEVEPFTQYAYYIMTKVPFNASTRVESKIQYVTSAIASK